MIMRRWTQLLGLCLLLLPLTIVCLPGDEWDNHGGGLSNWRYAEGERTISRQSVRNLTLKWQFGVGGDLTATPAIYKGIIYLTCFDGNVYAVNQKDGSLVWSRNLTQVTGLPPGPFLRTMGLDHVAARSTPTVYQNTLLVGLAGPSYVVAFNRLTGALLWSTLVEQHPWSTLTQSGTAYKGFYYFGVSSFEETVALDPTVECCYFIGSFQKLDIRSGKVVWKTRTLPDNGGKTGLYSGAAVWGSSPAIDTKRQLVYIATGNVYTTPPEVVACETRQQNLTTPEVPDPCLAPDNLGNSILALELGSGNIRWGRTLGGYDAWNFACLLGQGSPNCPIGPALDYDFGQAPMLLTISSDGKWRDVAVAAQKSGTVWALDRDTGDLVWDTVTGPAGQSGGAILGSATDGKFVFVNNANSEKRDFTLVPSTEVTTGGGWVGLDARTGAILWTTAAPNNAGLVAPVTFANGVLFVATLNPSGEVFALDATDGHILWTSSAITGASRGGFSVSQGCAFISNQSPGPALSAFCVQTAS